MSKSLMIKSDRLKKVRKPSKATVAKKSANRKSVGTRGTIAEERPDLLEIWDWDRNREIGLDPNVVTCGMDKTAYWLCKKYGHSYTQNIDTRIKSSADCPYCDGRRLLTGFNDLASLYPDIAAEWMYAVDGKSTPQTVMAGSDKRVMWKCSKHGVEWVTTVYTRTSGSGCSKCKGEKISKTRTRLSPGDSLAEKYPDVAAQWDYELNDGSPDKIHAHAKAKKHWVCKECGHKWVSPIYSRTCNLSGCPKCSSKRVGFARSKPVPGNSLAEKYPVIASEFVRTLDGVTDPYEVSFGSEKKCEWTCSVCHDVTWFTTPANRTYRKEDVGGCPKCALIRGSKRSRKPRTAGFLVDKAPEIAREWDIEKNREEYDLELDAVSMSCNVHAYWICSTCGRSFKNSVNHRTHRGDGCPFCNHRSRTSFPERAVLFYVQKAFSDAEGNATPDIDGMRKLEFDVWIPSKNIAIEYDGQRWHQDANRDLEKEDICINNGVTLIRIRETKCVDYDHQLCHIIYRNQNGAYKSLDKAINELFEILDVFDVDVDTARDNGEIRKRAKMDYVKDSLGELRPDIVEYWDAESNGQLTPYMFKRNSTHVANWRCPNCDARWTKAIVYMNHRKKLCQECGARATMCD